MGIVRQFNRLTPSKKLLAGIVGIAAFRLLWEILSNLLDGLSNWELLAWLVGLAVFSQIFLDRSVLNRILK